MIQCGLTGTIPGLEEFAPDPDMLQPVEETPVLVAVPAQFHLPLRLRSKKRKGKKKAVRKGTR